MKTGIFIHGDCRIIVALENNLWHLSISCKGRLPTYEEIKKARYDLTPNDVHMAEIFPPKEEFVNIHPFTRHLWQIDNKDDVKQGIFRIINKLHDNCDGYEIHIRHLFQDKQAARLFKLTGVDFTDMFKIEEANKP